jgi:hypothetical protein
MKVFYVTTFGNNVFYVRAENSEAAKEHLIEQVKKYYFKHELKGDVVATPPETLGKDIIVELGMHRGILDDNEDIVVEDITATAYIFSSAGKPYWKDWDLTVTDVIQAD